MRVICKYSATEFQLPHFRGSYIEGVHPLFSLSTSELLAYAKDWAAEKLSVDECRVLFLALLASGTTEVTEYDSRNRKVTSKVPLVDFRVPAIPSHSIVQKNMERLMRTMLWVSSINTALLKLPRVAITQDVRKLEQVGSWIQAWEDEREYFYKSHKSKALASKLSSLEEQLIKLIRSSHRTTESYAGTMAKWALDASGFPDKTPLDLETRELYTKLFKLKGFEVFTADKDHIFDLLTWMEANLSHGSIMANATLNHLRKIAYNNEHGLNKSLGLINGNTFELLEDPVGEHNLSIIASKAPEVFPEPHLYPTKVAYLRARAAWNTAELFRKKALADKEAELKKLRDMEIMDFTTEEELVASQSEELDNLLQGKLNLGDLTDDIEDF